MATQRNHAGIHWRTPTVMLLSLIAAIALAVGHHFFYAALEDSEVDAKSMRIAGLATTSQQINTSAGTAFAFFVKSFLVLATSTAYFQLIFGLMQRSAFKVSTLDDWFSGTSNLFSLAYLSSYWRHPLLPLVALTVWLLPICAIVAPAALTVTFGEIRPWRVESRHVASPAFESLALDAFWQGYPYENNNSARFRVGYTGPDPEVTRIAQAVAFTGDILSIPPPGLNTSWTMHLIAPSLSCETMNSTYREALKSNIKKVMNISATDESVNMCRVEGGYYSDFYPCPVDDPAPLMFSYLAWFGEELPFYWPNVVKSEASMTSGSDRFKRIEDYTLGVTVFPRAMHDYERLYWRDNPWANDTLIDEMFQDATLLQCKFNSWNYTLRFAYEGVAQAQKVEILSHRQAHNITSYCLSDSDSLELNSSDTGLMFNTGDCTFRNTGSSELTTPRVKEILSYWSYTALLTAFASIITGGQNAAEGTVPGSAILYGSNTNNLNTRIFSSVLSNTIELAPISGKSTPLNVSYSNATSDLAHHQALSLTRPQNSISPRIHLSDALEEGFFNTTISLASSEKLRYNTSSPLAPPPVDVTFKTYGNIYAYDPSKLWLTYGLAIGITILNVIFGLVSMFRTGASFTANFSSIIRIAKNASIDVNLTEPNLPGKDPCPKDVAEAQLVVDSGYDDMSAKKGVRDFGAISTTYKPVEQTVREVESEQESLRGR